MTKLQNNDTTRKLHPQSTIGKLSISQRKKLQHWLIADELTYREAVEKLASEFGLKTSQQTVSKFWKQFCQPILLRRAILKRQAVEGIPALTLDLNFILRRGEQIIGATSVNAPVCAEVKPDHASAGPGNRRNQKSQ